MIYKYFSLYRFLRFIYWSIPDVLRIKMEKYRFKFSCNYKYLSAKFSKRSKSDLTWGEFRNQVLDELDLTTLVLVFEPTIDWGATLFQRPQQMALALGRKGCVVLYRTFGDNILGVKKIAENVWLVRNKEVEKLRNVIWCVYSTTPYVDRKTLNTRHKSGRVVYEYIDHIDTAIFGSSSMVNRLNLLKDAACSGCADYLVASAIELCDELRESVKDKSITYIPNGVDVAHFLDKKYNSAILPDEYMRFIKMHRKIVGYFGAIAPWLWYDVINELTDHLSDVGFVFIGPDYYDCVKKIKSKDNIMYLGKIDYNILPAYAIKFNVCFIPFSPGKIARTTSPLKLYEYFSLAKPVVVTADMHECTKFQVVYSGYDTNSLVEAINNAFEAEERPDYCNAVLSLAVQNSWDVRADTYIKMLDQKFNE